MAELKKCPFCGGELVRNMWGNYEHDRTECLLVGFEIPEKWFSLWNTRKPIEQIINRLEDEKTKRFVSGITSNPYEFGACHAMDIAIEIVKDEGMAQHESI